MASTFHDRATLATALADFFRLYDGDAAEAVAEVGRVGRTAAEAVAAERGEDAAWFAAGEALDGLLGDAADHLRREANE